jgi:hypothetical protein
MDAVEDAAVITMFTIAGNTVVIKSTASNPSIIANQQLVYLSRYQALWETPDVHELGHEMIRMQAPLAAVDKLTTAQDCE